MFIKNYQASVSLFIIFLLLSGCGSGPKLKQAHEILAPEPIYGNSGKYMCPYTEDDVLADWVDKAVNAKAGAQVGAAVGAYAGAKALEMVPLFGGMLGKYAGQAIGRQIAISASGGMEYITSTSDLSFNSLEDLSVYLYVKHSSHDHYQDALAATMEIYPDLKKVYQGALYRASAKAPSPEQLAKIREQREQMQQKKEEQATIITTVRTVKEKPEAAPLEESATQVTASDNSDADSSKEEVISVDESSNNTNASSSVIETVDIPDKDKSPNKQIVETRIEPKVESKVEQDYVIQRVDTVATSEEPKVEIDTSTKVDEDVERIERSGSYATTTSKITTVTTVKTVTTPEKRTIIYKQVK